MSFIVKPGWRPLEPIETIKEGDCFFNQILTDKPASIADAAIGKKAEHWEGGTWWPYRKVGREAYQPHAIHGQPLPLP
jgi:hypothetical protein